MSLILFLLATIGLTNIMVESTLLKPVRDKLNWQVFNCHQCMGTWCGLVCGLLIYYNCSILLYAFAGSCVATYTALLVQWISS